MRNSGCCPENRARPRSGTRWRLQRPDALRKSWTTSPVVRTLRNGNRGCERRWRSCGSWRPTTGGGPTPTSARRRTWTRRARQSSAVPRSIAQPATADSRAVSRRRSPIPCTVRRRPSGVSPPATPRRPVSSPAPPTPRSRHSRRSRPRLAAGGRSNNLSSAPRTAPPRGSKL